MRVKGPVLVWGRGIWDLNGQAMEQLRVQWGWNVPTQVCNATADADHTIDASLSSTAGKAGCALRGGCSATAAWQEPPNRLQVSSKPAFLASRLLSPARCICPQLFALQG